MDVVYVCRDGDNPELRYSLRSLANVPHERVFIFGGCPAWVNTDVVTHVSSPQHVSPYASTRAHIKAACQHAEVSDPFMLWNDDFYAMEPVDELPVMCRGSLAEMVERFAKTQTTWARGIRETAVLLRDLGYEAPVSYDLHVPLPVHKSKMLEALKLAKRVRGDAVHVRTIYGNLAGLGGTEMLDVKMMRRSDPIPRGPWLSSGDNTFRAVVEPVLRYLFPDPCAYEKG